MPRHTDPGAHPRLEEELESLATVNVRHEGVWLAALLCVGFALRAWVAVRNPVIFDDGPAFIDIARAMARGDVGWVLGHPYHPFYSLLVWGTPGSAGHEEAVAVGWSVVSGTASVAALWWFLRPLFGGVVPLVAAAVLVVHPYAVRFSGDVQSDQVSLALFLCASGLLVRALAGARVGLAFAAGLVTSLAYLTRPEGVGVAVVGVALASMAALRGSWPVRRALAFVASLGAGFTLLAAPYIVGIWLATGELRLTQKKSLATLLGLAGPGWSDSDLVVRVGVLALALGLAWATRAKLLAWATALRVRRFGATEVAAAVGCAVLVAFAVSPTDAALFAALFASTLRPELALLLAIGVASTAIRAGVPSGRAFFFLFFAGVYGVALFGLLLTAGYLDRRHLLPLAVLLLGYAAIGLEVIAGVWARRRGVSPGRAIAVGVCICIAIALPKTLDAQRHEQVAARDAALWVGEVAAPGDRIASTRPKAAYYAGLVWVPLHDAEGLLDGAELRSMGARWVLAEPEDLALDDPDLLGSRPADGQRFERVHQVERFGRRAVVYEVHEPTPGWAPAQP